MSGLPLIKARTLFTVLSYFSHSRRNCLREKEGNGFFARRVRIVSTSLVLGSGLSASTSPEVNCAGGMVTGALPRQSSFETFAACFGALLHRVSP